MRLGGGKGGEMGTEDKQTTGGDAAQGEKGKEVLDI